MNHVEDILKKSSEIHLKKRQDYATNPNEDPLENFKRSNEIASWFPNEYKSFAVLIGTKLARLGALLSSGRSANNESIEDTFLDLVTYSALMYEFHEKSLEARQRFIEQKSLGTEPSTETPVCPYCKGNITRLHSFVNTPTGKAHMSCWNAQPIQKTDKKHCQSHLSYYEECSNCRKVNQIETGLKSPKDDK